jgi:hypothetical protein
MKLSFIVKNFFFRVINMKAWQSYMALVFTFHLAVLTVSGQESSATPSKTEAQEAWNRGNYEVAYNHFNGLLLLYSRDPVYRYYTGACLVQMERDLPRSETLLGSAINGSVNIKSVPYDVWFYYARALQMNGSFTQASDAYQTFVKNSGKKVAQEYDVQKYIDECSRGQGARSMQQGAWGPGQGEERTLSADASTKAEREEQEAQGSEHGAQSEASEVADEFDRKLSEAVKLQYSTDSLTRLAQGVRKEMETAAPEKQEVLQSIAEEIESEAAAKQAKADMAFMAAEQNGNPVPEVSPGYLQPEQGQAYAQFAMLSSPAYSNANPIPFDIKLPPGLIYTIQLAAFKNPVQPSVFKGLFPLYGRKKPDNGVSYYYTGIFRINEDARQALSKVRAEGFSDAFIIAMMDDAQVSMERATMLEKEWAAKPLPLNEPAVQQGKNVPAADTLPVGTLTFRAEAIRSKKPLKPEAIEKIELLAGTRGLDMIKNNMDETVLLIGNFITFESADEYVSLLIRNGYSTARVAAYVGMQEIPVEAAKELLNRIE